MPREYKLEHKGSITHVIDDKRPKGITIRLVLAWIFSVLFLVSGIGNMINASLIGGLLLVLAGLVLFPPIDAAIRNQWNFYLSSWLKFFIVLILISIASSIIIAEGFAKVSSQYGMPSDTANSGNRDVADIPAKQQETTSLAYTEDDAKNAIAEGKGMADNQQQKNAFLGKYTFTSTIDNSWIVVGTPYAATAINIATKIEKYDPYTLEDALTMINYNGVIANVYGLVTDKAYFTYLNKDDLRAVIEYDNGKICRGEISDVKSELGDMDSTYNYKYETTVLSTFNNCYSEIHNKVVDFVYVLGSEKFKFKVDMSKLK